MGRVGGILQRGFFFRLLFFSLLCCKVNAELPCWNDATLAYASGGISDSQEKKSSGVSVDEQGEIRATDPNGPECKGSMTDGDPVNTSTGNFCYTNQDLVLPSHRGFPLEIKRIYNSLDPSEGPFGVGWSFNYYVYIFEITHKGNLYVIQKNPDGSKIRHLKNPDGSFKNITAGNHDVLCKYQQFPEEIQKFCPGDLTAGYVVRSKDVIHSIFDLEGNWRVWVDCNSNTVTLDYDKEGQIVSVRDQLNRGFQFIYEEECRGRIRWIKVGLNFVYSITNRFSIA